VARFFAHVYHFHRHLLFQNIFVVDCLYISLYFDSGKQSCQSHNQLIHFIIYTSIPAVMCSPECSNGGTCQINNVCMCPPGFTGSHCETKKPQDCSSAGMMCTPPSVCVQQQGGSYSCQCPEGKSGHDCSLELSGTTAAPGKIYFDSFNLRKKNC